jgi:hypothetical protein
MGIMQLSSYQAELSVPTLARNVLMRQCASNSLKAVTIEQRRGNKLVKWGKIQQYQPSMSEPVLETW